jgi:hypothetical protein
VTIRHKTVIFGAASLRSDDKAVSVAARALRHP